MHLKSELQWIIQSYNGNLKDRLRNTADDVTRHSKLCLSTVYYVVSFDQVD